MNARDLATLDAAVERDLERPTVSRASSRLEVDARHAEEEAERAIEEERRRALERAGGFLLGRVADQRGRTLEVISANGYVIVKAPSILTLGVVFVVDHHQAAGLADALERGAGGVPALDGFLQVEREPTGLLHPRCRDRQPERRHPRSDERGRGRSTGRGTQAGRTSDTHETPGGQPRSRRLASTSRTRPRLNITVNTLDTSASAWRALRGRLPVPITCCARG